MKPDWKDAPEWANYLAMDEDGNWYWYESEPRPWSTYWGRTCGQTCLASESEDWTETLEQRPEEH